MAKGSIGDHDVLVVTLEVIDSYKNPIDVPMALLACLQVVATRCGWDGEESVVVWSRRRSETYTRVIRAGRT